MRVGVPREVESGEARVTITPAGVRELTAQGHEVPVEAALGRPARPVPEVPGLAA